MLTQEQIEQIKEQIIQQIESNFPEDKKEYAKQQIESMNAEQLEEFLKQNKLIKAGEPPQGRVGGEPVSSSLNNVYFVQSFPEILNLIK